MRLTTAGLANGFSKGVVGIVTRVPLPIEARTDRILVAETVPNNPKELIDYKGFLTNAKLERQFEAPPPAYPSFGPAFLKNVR
jgi:hypothetical protein